MIDSFMAGTAAFTVLAESALDSVLSDIVGRLARGLLLELSAAASVAESK